MSNLETLKAEVESNNVAWGEVMERAHDMRRGGVPGDITELLYTAAEDLIDCERDAQMERDLEVVWEFA